LSPQGGFSGERELKISKDGNSSEKRSKKWRDDHGSKLKIVVNVVYQGQK
jgi:hypothetical protein